MDEVVKSLVYPGSPFLPIINEKNVQDIVKYTEQAQSITGAIAFEIIFIGTKQYQLHLTQIDYLKNIYELSQNDLDEYLFGFITPPFLILTALSQGDPQEFLDILSSTVFYTHPRTSALNVYLKKHMYEAQILSLLSDLNSPIEIAQPLYTICDQDLASDNLYFKVGLTASENLFANCHNLCQLLTNQKAADG